MTSSPVLAALFAFLAAHALVPSRSRALHRLASGRRSRRPSLGARQLARSAHRRLALTAVATTTLLCIALALGIPATLTTLSVLAVTAVVLNQRAKAVHRREAAVRRAQVIEACDLLSADLTAGRPPHAALEGAATVCPDLTSAAAAARLGGDVPAVLRLAADTPGAEGLKALSAAWQVADESGSAFATITERLAHALRAEEATRRQVTANLAGARTTARLLAVLPAFGTLLGYALGGDPLTFLTTTLPGTLCLVTGLALSITGLHWTDRLSADP